MDLVKTMGEGYEFKGCDKNIKKSSIYLFMEGLLEGGIYRSMYL